MLNVFGLSIALSAFYILMTQVEYNVTYNHNIKDWENVYRMEIQGLRGGENWTHGMPRAMMGALKCCPHVKEVESTFITEWNYPVLVGEKSFTNLISTTISDPGLDFFGVKMLEGTSRYKNFYEAVITRKTAICMFGTEHAVGKTFRIPQLEDEDEDSTQLAGDSKKEHHGLFTVVGVCEDFPLNCMLTSNIFIGSLDEDINNWTNCNSIIYARIDSPEHCEDAITVARKSISEAYGYKTWEECKKAMKYDVRLTPLSETYFSDVAASDIGNKSMVTIIFWAAIFLIIVAFINFNNFTLAQCPQRIHGINTRKVMGASVWQLRAEYVAECAMWAILAFALSVLWIELFTKNSYCSQLATGNIDIANHLTVIAITFAAALLIGIVSSIYPAYFCTSFSPILAMKGNFNLSPTGRKLRTALVGLQLVVGFAITVFIGVMTAQTQLIFTSDYGFDKDEVFYSKLSEAGMNNKEALTNELEAQPWVESVAYGQFDLGSQDWYMQWVSSDENGERISYTVICVDYKYLRTMGIKMVEGRDFNASDKGAFIINESTKKLWKHEVGAPLSTKEENDFFSAFGYPVVGICKDFRLSTFRNDNKATRMAFVVCGDDLESWGDNCKYIFIRVKAGYDKIKAKEQATEILNKKCGDIDYNLTFLDDRLQDTYYEELIFISQVKMFAAIVLALVIVGVFCLTMFETESRRKEIAIRKVMGSSVGKVLLLLAKRHLIALCISFIIAAPIGYAVSNIWLQNFCTRVAIHWWLFPIAFLIVSIIVILTVIIQSWRVATMNPYENIKTE